jgi:hypothetical protein
MGGQIKMKSFFDPEKRDIGLLQCHYFHRFDVSMRHCHGSAIGSPTLGIKQTTLGRVFSPWISALSNPGRT